MRAVKLEFGSDTCGICTMDCLCLIGSEVFEVSIECDLIGIHDYCLKLVNEK